MVAEMCLNAVRREAVTGTSRSAPAVTVGSHSAHADGGSEFVIPFLQPSSASSSSPQQQDHGGEAASGGADVSWRDFPRALGGGRFAFPLHDVAGLGCLATDPARCPARRLLSELRDGVSAADAVLGAMCANNVSNTGAPSPTEGQRQKDWSDDVFELGLRLQALWQRARQCLHPRHWLCSALHDRQVRKAHAVSPFLFQSIPPLAPADTDADAGHSLRCRHRRRRPSRAAPCCCRFGCVPPSGAQSRPKESPRWPRTAAPSCRTWLTCDPCCARQHPACAPATTDSYQRCTRGWVPRCILLRPTRRPPMHLPSMKNLRLMATVPTCSHRCGHSTRPLTPSGCVGGTRGPGREANHRQL